MPTLSETREALVNRLAPIRDAGVLVRGLPNKTAEYGQLNGSPQVLVYWKEDRPEAPELTDEMFQKNRQDWIFEVRSPEMRGERGLEVLVEAVHSLIYGFEPPNCQKMSLKGREFFKQENYWFAESTYTASSYLVAAKPVAIETLLAQTQFNDDFGGVTVGGIQV